MKNYFLLKPSITALLLLGIVLLVAVLVRFRRKRGNRPRIASEDAAQPKLSVDAEIEQLFTRAALGAPVDKPPAIVEPAQTSTEETITATPAAASFIPIGSRTQETPAPSSAITSVPHSSEAQPVISEESFSETCVPSERTDVELKKLIAGREYDSVSDLPLSIANFAPPRVVSAVSSQSQNEDFAAEEALLLREEEALRRAAEELESRKRAAEAARRKAEEEARLKAEKEAHLRREAEARNRAEEEARRKEAEAAARRQREEAALLKEEQEERARVEAEARLHAEEEERFQLEAQTLRRAAEELARKRAEAEAARKLAEEELEEERLKREAQERRAQEEERLRREQEALTQATAELAQTRAEIEESRKKAEEEARLLSESWKRIKAEEEAAWLQMVTERERFEAEAQRRLNEERQRLEEARRKADEQQRQIEEELRRFGEEDERRLIGLELVRKQFEEESTRRTLQEHRIRTEIDALRHAEQEQRNRIEAETRRRAEMKEETSKLAREAQLRLEEEARRRAEVEALIRDDNYDEIESAPMSEEVVSSGDTPKDFIVTSDQAKQIDIMQTEKGLMQTAEDTAIPTDLVERLNSKQSSDRAAALADLSRIGGDDAFSNISRMFDDPTADVRNAAARALYALQADRAASFTRALREGCPERRRRIGAALAASGLASDAIDNLTGESREKTYDAFSLLFLMAKAGEVQPLMRAIEDYSDVEVRLAVVKLLALSDQPEIVPALRRLAVRGSLPSEVRSALMEAIYQISNQTRETTPSAA